MSGLTACREFITANYLNHWQTNETEILPQLSANSNCSGPFQPTQTQIDTHVNTFVTYQTLIGEITIDSIYIPANWQATFRATLSGSIRELFIRGPYLSSTQGPQDVFPGTNVGILGIASLNVTVKFERVAIEPAEGVNVSWTINRRNICLGKNEFNLEGAIIPLYQPHELFCDNIIATYCRANHFTPTVCSCFAARTALEQRFPTINLPPTCFNQECGQFGYRTREFASEKCSLTVCQDILRQNGEQIFDSGSTTIFCGGKLFDRQDVATPTVVPTPSVEPLTADNSIPFYMWILFSVVVLLVAFLIYIIVIKYQDPRTTRFAQR